MTTHETAGLVCQQRPFISNPLVMMRSLLFGLLLILFIVPFGMCQLNQCSLGINQKVRYDWSFQFRGGQYRDGFIECEDSITLAKAKSQSLQVLWSDPSAYFAAGNSTPAANPGNSLQNTTDDLYIASSWGGVGAYDANGIWGDEGNGLESCPADPNHPGVHNCGPYWQNYNLPSSIFGSSVAAYVVNVNGAMKRLVFFVGDTGITAMDASTGAAVWNGSFGSPNYLNTSDIASSPLYETGTLYVGGKDGFLYAFDAGGNAAGCPAACTPKWKSAAIDNNKHSIVSSPAIVNAKVGKLIAVGDMSTVGPDFGGFTLYYANDYNLDGKKAGEIYWHSPAGFGQVVGTPLMWGGKVYVIGNSVYTTVKWTTFYNTFIYAIDPDAPGGPAIPWKYQLSGYTPSSAAIEYERQFGQYCGPNGCYTPPDVYDILYVASGSQIYGFDLQKSGLLTCNQTLGYTTGWSSPATSKDVLFVGGSDGAVHAFDTTQCKAGGSITEVWSTQLSSQPIDSSPVIANGTLFVNTQSGLFAIK